MRLMRAALPSVALVWMILALGCGSDGGGSDGDDSFDASQDGTDAADGMGTDAADADGFGPDGADAEGAGTDAADAEGAGTDAADADGFGTDAADAEGAGTDAADGSDDGVDTGPKIPPNLIAGSVSSAAEQVLQGLTFTIDYVVENDQDGDSGPFTITIYLSEDQVLDAGDAIAAKDGMAVAANQVENASVLGQTGDLPTGEYYLILSVDSDSEVEETDETDNRIASAATIEIVETGPPDLIGSLELPADPPYVGQPVELGFEVSNVGVGYVGFDFDVQMFLSDDAVLTGDDTDLGTVTVEASTASILPGGSATGAISTTIPDQTTATHVFLVVDSGEEIEESDEDNNVSMQAVTIAAKPQEPDLAAAGTTLAPGELPFVRAGSTVAFDVSYQELAGFAVAAATPFDVVLYLSPDPEITTDDIPVGTWQDTDGVAAGGSGSTTITAAIPAETSSGEYYIGASIDDGGDVSEAAEYNNIDAADGAAVVEVVATLAANEYDLSLGDGAWIDIYWDFPGDNRAEITSGATVFADAEVVEVGSPVEASYTIGFYVSEDPEVTVDDTLIGSVTPTPAELADALYDVEVELTIPELIPYQTYYYAAIVDSEDVIEEVDETNNTSYSEPFTVVGADDAMVDLQLWDCADTTVDALQLDSPYHLAYPIGAVGTMSAGPFVVRFFLDTDGDGQIEANGDDVEIGSESFSGGLALHNMLEAFGDGALIAPSGTVTPGDYQLGWIIDADETVTETDEANNVCVSGAQVSVAATAKPDAVVVLGLPDESYFADVIKAESGATFEFPLTYYANYGGSATGAAMTITYYLSSDESAHTPGDDVAVGTYEVPAGLAAGSWGFTQGTSMDLTGVAAGTRYLYALIDSGDAVDEADEGNNDSAGYDAGDGPFGFWTCIISGAAPLPDLSIAVIEHEDQYQYNGVNSGFWGDADITNSSAGATAGESLITQWISEDDSAEVSDGDVFLDAYPVGYVPPFVVVGMRVDATLGFEPTIGTPYYIKLVLDGFGEVDEADEDNNIGVTGAFTFED